MQEQANEKQQQSRRWIGVLMGNGLLALSVLFGGVSLQWLMLAYVLQTWMLLYFHARRMGALTVFSTEGVKVNGKSVQPTQGVKRSMTGFFVLHFGVFNVTYIAFLAQASSAQWFGGSQIEQTLGIGMLCASLISIGWGMHTQMHRLIGYDKKTKPNIGTLMFTPYVRIIPMHVMMVFFSFAIDPNKSVQAAGVLAQVGSMGAALVFLGLKSISEWVIDRMQEPKDYARVMARPESKQTAQGFALEQNDRATVVGSVYESERGSWMLEEQKIVAFWEKRFEDQIQKDALRTALVQKALDLGIKVQRLYEEPVFESALQEAFEQTLNPMSRGLYRLAGKKLQEHARNLMGEQLWSEHLKMQHEQRVRWAKRVLDSLEGTGEEKDKMLSARAQRIKNT